ncbi:hypothetical protein P0Y31_18250 [Knoellia sp. 3-2P3]|uniref:hypothetical protein n=1 Tax=unclassified Knoellia TaxID=2618719 RepID=UPI0023DB1CD6|nr:hypothetical protein [Knoellia sp. 3-2P3]MDF2094290.1 hypothetical protein [Knoellia sp. 3-2P3]
MGLLDKLLTAGGVAAVGAVATGAYKTAQETKRRKNSPLCFDEGITQSEFITIVRDAAERTPRVQNAVTNGMSVTLYVKSNSGLSTWKAEIDFNDYGHLTGEYWLQSDNPNSLIPKYFVNAVRAQIVGRVAKGR